MKPGPLAFSILLVATATVAQANLLDGLVSYWPLETVDVDKTPDLVSGNHLFLHNLDETNFVPGRRGKALSLDGASQFASHNYTSNPKLPIQASDNFTVAFWVKGAPNQANKIIFAEGQTADSKPLFLLGTQRMGQGASLNVFLRDKSDEIIPNVPSEMVVFDQAWHHIAWVDEGGVARLYVDGLLDVTSFIYEKQKINLNYIAIGALLRTPPAYYFKGEVDEVTLWRRALEQKEVQQVMNLSLASVLSPSTVSQTP